MTDTHTTPKLVRFGQYMAVVIILGFTLLLCLIGWWELMPARVLAPGGKLSVYVKSVEAGEDLVYSLTLCKQIELPSTLHRQLVDTVQWTLPDQQTNFPVGCHEHWLTQHIPRVFTSGKYQLVITITYDVNPIRTISYTFKSEPFMVTTPKILIVPGPSNDEDGGR